LGRLILSRRLRAGFQVAPVVCGDAGRPESERDRRSAPRVSIVSSSLSLLAIAPSLTWKLNTYFLCFCYAFVTGRHVGDGNFHCGLIFLPQDFKKVDEAAHRMVDRAIALGGTCTGEH
jgi:FAD/FMN-containing dehydrogenase